MKTQCPKCQKAVTWEENPYRPFCSQDCKKRDLGEWASETYRIAQKNAPGDSNPDDDSES